MINNAIGINLVGKKKPAVHHHYIGINEEEEKVVHKIYELFNAGYGYIATAINCQGWTSS
ncbi:hypothetical protein KHQ82_04365 [Mycoplasmatota bacterium]|nr:hypothetical protein KHQ82_04365 [Mycoplasmatota bacterium]